ncbi:bestrophin-4 [Parasteatoda tepidariorum]|uniref:Bestrophin homolog n=1 Tax=Parasteatoda tepidariorum TaxID=114398 RepID=A0A2L2YCT5_PARTP|nr:bestrophin-2 [Parasteatoda tepidariorum]XP_042906012.1 bestrophin-2 [Parasteatoda tepidariorum]
MTVTYSLNVSKARLCGFAKLLVRWRGSIYKLLYREMVIFCGLYYSLSLLYRYVFTENQRTVFEKLTIYCEAFTNLIPLSFVLGFYVSIVVGRWWQQYMAIPWPDKVSMLIASYVHGSDERGKVIRRTLVRYLILLSALTFQAVSTSVKKRFPTLDHVEEAGLMTKEERRVYDDIHVTHGKWWVPAQWFSSLAARARKEGRIKDDILLQDLLQEMHVFRGNCGMLFSYDWISIPLVYTQVVTLAIYTYFLATVMGRQYLDPEKGYPGHEVDLYIPIFTLLQFFFYMGWLKVAEQLINPFGEDDDDFELNWCLDRNLQVSFMIVDEMHQRHPRLVKDMYWDELEPQLPYTKSSFMMRTQPHLGSAVNLDIDPEEAEFVPMETILEEDNDNNNYNSPPQSPTNELSPGFRSFAGSKINLNGEDNVSQSGLRFLEHFPGAKLLNMIIGSSNENLTGTPKTPKKEGSIFSGFTLKTPNRRSISSSIAESLHDQMLDGRRDVGEPLIPTRAGTPIQSEREDLRHIILDIPPESNSIDSGQSTPATVIEDYNRCHDLASPATIIEDYNRRHDLAPPATLIEDYNRRHDLASSAAIIEDYNRRHDLGHHATIVHKEVDPNPDENPVIDQSPPSSPNEGEPSPFEPNSSQESLVPYVDSNQSTVSSYAELLKHPK